MKSLSSRSKNNTKIILQAYSVVDGRFGVDGTWPGWVSL